jgi:hypothetical protein
VHPSTASYEPSSSQTNTNSPEPSIIGLAVTFGNLCRAVISLFSGLVCSPLSVYELFTELNHDPGVKMRRCCHLPQKGAFLHLLQHAFRQASGKLSQREVASAVQSLLRCYSTRISHLCFGMPADSAAVAASHTRHVACIYSKWGPTHTRQTLVAAYATDRGTCPQRPIVS